MSSQLERFTQFLEPLRDGHRSAFPQVRADKVLTFMGTTSLPGSTASVSLHRLRGVEGTGHPGHLRVRLGGLLPRRPGPGECVAVHLVRLEQYRGFQVKTLPLGPGASVADLVVESGDELTVNGARLYTVHHGPYTLRFFEEIPVEEVCDLAAGLPFALAAVGEAANLSPRFVFHHEVRDGVVQLFHGDGLALKTAMNLRSNPREARVVLDLARPGGWQLLGRVEPIRQQEHPVGWEKVHAGFASSGWGAPSRVYRFVAEALEPIDFAGPAAPG